MPISMAVSSIKSMVGHLFGAAGAIEALATALTIHSGVIPPTINYRAPDPECDLDYVPNEAREADVRVALSNSMGLGGPQRLRHPAPVRATKGSDRQSGSDPFLPEPHAPVAPQLAD